MVPGIASRGVHAALPGNEKCYALCELQLLNLTEIIRSGNYLLTELDHSGVFRA